MFLVPSLPHSYEQPLSHPYDNNLYTQCLLHTRILSCIPSIFFLTMQHLPFPHVCQAHAACPSRAQSKIAQCTVWPNMDKQMQVQHNTHVHHSIPTKPVCSRWTSQPGFLGRLLTLVSRDTDFACHCDGLSITRMSWRGQQTWVSGKVNQLQ